jgi:hypothetical protein
VDRVSGIVERRVAMVCCFTILRHWEPERKRAGLESTLSDF